MQLLHLLEASCVFTSLCFLRNLRNNVSVFEKKLSVRSCLHRKRAHVASAVFLLLSLFFVQPLQNELFLSGILFNSLR